MVLSWQLCGTYLWHGGIRSSLFCCASVMTDWTDHILKTKIKWNQTRWWMTTKRILYNNIVVIKICTRTLLLNKYISAYGNFPYRNPTKSTQTKTLTPESWSVHPVTDAAAAILSMTLAKSSGVTKPGRSSEQKANCKGANLRNCWNFWRIRGPKTWIRGYEPWLLGCPGKLVNG